MNIKFITNDYLIAWNILFNKSVTESFRAAKQKLWNTYKNEYNKNFEDKNLILKYNKDFIPSNDIIYNALIEKEDFSLIKKDSEKSRLEFIKIWDKNKHSINYLMKKILRKKVSEYLCFCISKDFDTSEVLKVDEEGKIIIGLRFHDDNVLLIDIFNKILRQEVDSKEKESIGIKETIFELAMNEFTTNIYGESTYKAGNEELYYLKEQIYPYWLMYLGISRNDMVEYIKRDGFDFDPLDYAYERELIKLNLEEFIDFVIRNRRYILKVQKVKIDDEII